MAAVLTEPDFRELFQGAPGLYLVLTPELTIVAASDAYLRATMTVRDEVVGRHLFQIFPDNPDDASATGVDNLRTSLERVLEFRMPDAMAIQKYDIRRPDGSFEERHWSPLNVPVLDEGGYVKWIIHRVADVTEVVRLMQGTARQEVVVQEQESLIEQLSRANAELLARQSMILEREAHMRSVLETAPDAVVTIDQRGIVLSFSQAAERLFGYEAGEVIGCNVKMLMPSPHHEDHDGYLERYRRTGERRIIGIGRRVEARRKDGTIFPMELAVGEVKTGTTHIFTGFIRDLTARAKLEETLRQSQKMEAVGQLTGGIAHDFNNLLSVISGNLEMLGRRLHTADERELLQEAQEASELGAQLARRLLAFARRQPLRPEPVDLNASMGGLVDLLRRTLGESVEIEPRIAACLPLVCVDPGQIENALLNLAINARDAMPWGGKIVIETTLATVEPEAVLQDPELSPGRYVMLAVTDTGTGMPPEVRDRVFEPFFTTKDIGRGSGLGLSMVYGFVKQSGGHIRLYSEVGHGTTVRLYLPVTAAKPATPPVAAASAETRRAAERILVVEDQPRVRRLTVRRLTELGYSILEADSAAAALAIIDRGEAVDLLFTDVVMPGGMTGIELATVVRERRPDLKIILTSGFTELDEFRQSDLAKNARWLSKPHGMTELQATLCELFAAG